LQAKLVVSHSTSAKSKNSWRKNGRIVKSL